jgi:hypothetical protein
MEMVVEYFKDFEGVEPPHVTSLQTTVPNPSPARTRPSARAARRENRSMAPLLPCLAPSLGSFLYRGRVYVLRHRGHGQRSPSPGSLDPVLPEEREASLDGRVEGRGRRRPSGVKSAGVGEQEHAPLSNQLGAPAESKSRGAALAPQIHLDSRLEKVRLWREKWHLPLPGGGVRRRSPLHLRPDRGSGGADEVEKGRRRSRGRGREKLREGREGRQSEELPRAPREREGPTAASSRGRRRSKERDREGVKKERRD